jgi:hypothetical protein
MLVLCATRSTPKTIETNEITHMKTCTQMLKKTHLQFTRIQIQNDNKQSIFFSTCFKISKHEKLDFKITLKGIKPPQTLITKLKPYSQFTHKFQTAHDKLQKTNYLANKYVTADLLKIVSTTLVSKIKSAWSPPLCRYST